VYILLPMPLLDRLKEPPSLVCHRPEPGAPENGTSPHMFDEECPRNDGEGDDLGPEFEFMRKRSELIHVTDLLGSASKGNPDALAEASVNLNSAVVWLSAYLPPEEQTI
jgi:hypothetical protein